MPHRPPAEWEPQAWLWIGFPHDGEEWPGMLEPAQEQIAGFANAVIAGGDAVRLVCRDEDNAKRARDLVDASAQIHILPYGDIWLRDTGPIVVRSGKGDWEARRFAFNGWGEKYEMDGDREIGGLLAAQTGLFTKRYDWVLEGGAIDGDGTGLAVTTKQCLLNPNRNPLLTRAAIEERLAHDLGLTHLLWLGDGLIGDHTDGHVDNLARFVAPGRLAIPEAADRHDPNLRCYDDARRRAEAFGLEVVTLPSPGLYEIEDAIAPASYMNLVVTNRRVIVPQYGAPNDEEACAALASIFSGREVIGLPSDALLSGGGSFHCASMQMPRLFDLS